MKNSIFNAVCKTRYLALLVVLIFTCGNVWAETVTFTTTSSGGFSDNSKTASGVTVTMRNGSSTSTSWQTGHVRVYTGGGVTFSSTVSITRIEFTCTANKGSNHGPDKQNLASGSSGSYSTTNSSAVGVWTYANGATNIVFNATAQIRFTQIVVTYTPSAASHTLSSAVSPSGGGSVSLSATSVTEGSTATATATPNGGYVFSSWSISGTGSTLSSTTTNPTTVTMGTANATVTATFAARTAASITFVNAGTPAPTTSGYYVGESYTLPSTNNYSCNDKTFVGWSTVPVAETDIKPTSNFYEPGASATLDASQTFYAVFATESGGDPVSISGGDMASSLPSGWSATGTDGFYSNNGVKFNSTGDYILSGDISSHGLTSVTVKFKAGYNGSTGSVLRIEAIDEEGYEIGGVNFTPTETYTNQNTVNTVVVSASGTIYSVAVEMTEKTSNVGVKYCEVFKGGTTYSAYSTTCCTELGSINGSNCRT